MSVTCPSPYHPSAEVIKAVTHVIERVCSTLLSAAELVATSESQNPHLDAAIECMIERSVQKLDACGGALQAYGESKTLIRCLHTDDLIDKVIRQQKREEES